MHESMAYLLAPPLFPSLRLGQGTWGVNNPILFLWICRVDFSSKVFSPGVLRHCMSTLHVFDGFA